MLVMWFVACSQESTDDSVQTPTVDHVDYKAIEVFYNEQPTFDGVFTHAVVTIGGEQFDVVFDKEWGAYLSSIPPSGDIVGNVGTSNGTKVVENHLPDALGTLEPQPQLYLWLRLTDVEGQGTTLEPPGFFDGEQPDWLPGWEYTTP